MINFNFVSLRAELASGDSLAVTSYVKGGGIFLNSISTQFSSEPIQSLNQPEPVSLEYDLQENALSVVWARVQSSSSYDVDCAEGNLSIYSKAVIGSTNSHSIHVTDLITQLSHDTAITLSVSITAHSQEGSTPFIPCKSNDHEVKIYEFIKDVCIVRLSDSTAVAKWSFTHQRNLEGVNVLVVTTSISDGQEIVTQATGEKGSVLIDGLFGNKTYTAHLRYGGRMDCPVVGIPLMLPVPTSSGETLDLCYGEGPILNL